MRARFLIAGLVAAALTVASAAADDLRRLTLRQDLLGWEAVGRLDLGADGYCSGVLVETTLVLTAAHCLARGDGRLIDPREITFNAGLRDGEAVARRQGLRAIIHPGYRVDDADSARQVATDIALVELASPIPAATAAPFRVARLAASARQVAVVSFARGRDAAPSIDRQCRVVGRDSGVLAFDCDVDFGASGAPVLAWGERRARIVSLVSKGRREGDASLGFGMELAPRYDELLGLFRSGRGVYPVAGTGARRLQAGERGTGGARFVRP
jgi:protease YdgD